jgi:hypothetical protein
MNIYYEHRGPHLSRVYSQVLGVKVNACEGWGD